MAQPNPYTQGLMAGASAPVDPNNPGGTFADLVAGKYGPGGTGFAPGTQFKFIDDGGLSGLMDNIIKFGAIGGSAATGAAGGVGLLGPGNSGLSLAQSGLASVGGLGDTAGSLASLGTTAPEISNFTPPNIQQPPVLDTSGMAPLNIADAGAGLGTGGSLVSSLSKAKTAIDRVKLAQQLLNVVGGGGGPGSPSQQGMVGGTLVGQGSGGLTGNMKMMLQANAQAQMNGQPLPFPGLGGMGR